MPRPRRLGNAVLTRLLSAVAGRRLQDGQSGLRAMTGAAAARADVIHDYNYAQVLTLDLLAKGFRMTEVPIRYRRVRGRSFRCFPAYHFSATSAIVVLAGATRSPRWSLATMSPRAARASFRSPSMVFQRCRPASS